MKTSIITFAILLLTACIGCDNKPSTKVEPSKPVEVNAPDVQVKVDPQDGVKVKAPGIDVETK
jgi:hypothetical protein